MNQKGFTLVELLAVVVLTTVALGIASYSVIGAINASKKRSEEIFLKKLGRLIDDYITLSLNDGSNYSLSNDNSNEDIKCKNKAGEEASFVGEFLLSQLWGKNLVELDELVNPSNKKKCFVDKNPVVYVYKDSNFVYYYYLKLEEHNDCELKTEDIFSCNEVIK